MAFGFLVDLPLKFLGAKPSDVIPRALLLYSEVEMNNVTHAPVNVESKRIERGAPSGGLAFKFAPDCEMLRTPGLIGLPLREIAPVGRRLMLERRRRDAALDVARKTYEQAYVCSFLDVESFVAQPLASDDEIGRTIDLIEEARKSRAGDPLLGRAGDLLAAYRPPTTAQLRRWLLRQSDSLLVTAYRCPDLAEEGIRDRDGLLYAIGGNLIWLRLWTVFKRAFTECLRSADPNIDWWSTDAEIWRAINRVSLEQRLHVHFKPSEIRDWF